VEYLVDLAPALRCHCGSSGMVSGKSGQSQACVLQVEVAYMLLGEAVDGGPIICACCLYGKEKTHFPQSYMTGRGKMLHSREVMLHSEHYPDGA